MELFFLILNKEEYLEEIMEMFLELDIRGATVIDSVGMGRILAYEVPIFAGMRDLLPGSRPFNKTILTIVPKEKIDNIIAAIEQIIGNLSKPGTGIVFTVPVSNLKGISKGI